MSNMTIPDAAVHFGVSREAIHNRVRRGSLKSVVENGVKLVIIDKTMASSPRVQVKKVAVNSDDKYYKLLEEQNTKLQEKVEKLEGETRSLRDQKEQMLIAERIKIEQIYKDKDEQLKSILNTFQSQFMLSSPEVQEEHLEAEIEEETQDEEIQEIETEKDEIEEEKIQKGRLGIMSLKKYLKEQKLPLKKVLRIKDKFKKQAKTDKRIITIGKKYYLNLDKYDYRDLF